MKIVYPLYSKKAVGYLAFHFLIFCTYSVMMGFSIAAGENMSALLQGLVVVVVSVSAYLSVYKSGPFTPRIEITDDYVLYRPETFSSSQKISWSEIQSLSVSKLAIRIFMNNGDVEYFYFRDDVGVRKPLLKFIKHLGEQKKVEVTF